MFDPKEALPDPSDDAVEGHEEPRDEPFADWPTQSPIAPVGEIHSAGRLAQALGYRPWLGRRRLVARVLALLWLAMIVGGVIVSDWP